MCTTLFECLGTVIQQVELHDVYSRQRVNIPQRHAWIRDCLDGICTVLAELFVGVVHDGLKVIWLAQGCNFTSFADLELL